MFDAGAQETLTRLKEPRESSAPLEEVSEVGEEKPEGWLELFRWAEAENFTASGLAAVMEGDGEKVKLLAQSSLAYWEVVKPNDQVGVELIKGKKGKDHWQVNLTNEAGENVRTYKFHELIEVHAAKMREMKRVRAAQVDKANYLFMKWFGDAASPPEMSLVKENGKMMKVSMGGLKDTRFGDLLVNVDEWITVDQLEDRLVELNLGRRLSEKEIYTNLKAAYKKDYGRRAGLKAEELYIKYETKFGEIAEQMYESRNEKMAAMRDRAYRELSGSESKSPKARIKRWLSKANYQLSRPTSNVMTAARAAVGIVTYDSNPLRWLAGKTAGTIARKAYNVDVAKALRVEQAKSEWSVKELVGRVQEKLMKDYFTGEGMRRELGTEADMRGATVAAIEMAIKMNLLPQYLAQLPAFAGWNLTPGEIWSMFRSFKMFRGGPGSIRRMKEVWNEAESEREKKFLAISSVVAAPAFLIAEKVCPTFSVGILREMNPLVMADMAGMRVLNMFDKYLSKQGGKGTKYYRWLHAIESGITVAFTADSTLSLGERVQAYIQTRYVNPLGGIKTEAEMMKIAVEHPEYLVGKTPGLLGLLREVEHAVIEKITGREGMQGDQSRLSLRDENGSMSEYIVTQEEDLLNIVKVNEEGAFVWNEGKWEKWELDMGERQVAEVEYETERSEDGESERRLEMAVAEMKEELAVHDYVIWDEEGERFTFRMDLRGDGETLEEKVERLFSGVFDDVEDGVTAGLSGEEIAKMESGDETLETLAGEDDVYELQLYRELVKRLVEDAYYNGLDYDMENLKKGFVEVFMQAQVSETTFEGEIDYGQLYQYLFQGSEFTEDRIVVKDVFEDYYLVEEQIAERISFSVEGTVSESLSKYGYGISAEYGIYETATGRVIEDAAIYKTVDGEEVLQTYDALRVVRPGEEFILKFGEDRVNEYELPQIEAVEGEVEDDGLPPVVNVTPPPVEMPELVRDEQGRIVVGTIEAGDSVSSMITNELASIGSKPWTIVLDAMFAGEIKMYVEDAEGNFLRELDLDTMGVVFVGERLVIDDPDKVLDIPDVIDFQVTAEVEGVEVFEGLETTEQFEALREGLEMETASVGGSRMGVLAFDLNDPATTTLSLNPDENFQVGRLAHIPLAMMVLREVAQGNMSMSQKIEAIPDENGYVPDVEMLLRQLLTYGDPFAREELAGLLTGEEDAVAVLAELNEQYQATFNNENNDFFFGYERWGDDEAVASASDVMQILRLMSNEQFLGLEQQEFLWEMITQGTSRTNSGASARIFPDLEVAAFQTHGFITANNRTNNHEISVITTPEGKQVLVVSMMESLGIDQVNEWQREFVRDYIGVLEPEALEGVEVLSADMAWQLADSPPMERQFVSQVVNTNESLRDRYGGENFREINFDTSVSSDGFLRVTLEDEWGSTMVWLDAEQRVVMELSDSEYPAEFISIVETDINLVDDRVELIVQPNFGGVDLGGASEGLAEAVVSELESNGYVVNAVSVSGINGENWYEANEVSSTDNGVWVGEHRMVDPETHEFRISGGVGEVLNDERLGIYPEQGGAELRMAYVNSGSTYLESEYAKMQTFIEAFEEVSSRDIREVAYEDFEANFWNLVAGKVMAGGEVTTVSFSQQEWLSLMGLRESQLYFQDVRYLGVGMFATSSYYVDERALGERYGMDEEALELTRVGSKNMILVGERVTEMVGGLETAIGDKQVVYAYSDGTLSMKSDLEIAGRVEMSVAKRIHLDSSEEIGRELLSVIPLTALPEKFEEMGTLVEVGEVAVRTQYAGEEYLAATAEGEERVRAYVDPTTGRQYGLVGGSLIALVGASPTYSQWEEVYGSGKTVPEIYELRLLDTISGQTKGDGEQFYMRVDDALVNLEEIESGVVIAMRMGVEGQKMVMDQETRRWIYTDEAGERYTYSEEAGFVSYEEEVVAARDLFGGMEGLTNEAGIPLQYNGMPLLVEGELAYALNETGLILIGSIYDLNKTQLVADPQTAELWQSLGVESSRQWGEAISYERLLGYEQKLLHGIALSLDGYIEVGRGVIDPANSQPYELAMRGGQVLVDEVTGKPILTANGEYFIEVGGKLGQINESSLLEIDKFIEGKGVKNYMVSEPESLKQMAINELDKERVVNIFGWEIAFDLWPGTGDMPLNKPTILRDTELPVYSDGENLYVLEGREGWVKLGSEEGMLSSGLVGFTGPDGRFETVLPELVELVLVSKFYDMEEKAGILLGGYLSMWLAVLAKDLKYEDVLENVVGSENYLTYEEMPLTYIQAMLAVEDKHTFDRDESEEGPISGYGLLRALPTYVLGKLGLSEGRAFGGSTITHQFLRNALLSAEERSDPSLERKLWEWTTAKDALEKLGVAKIIESYVHLSNYHGLGPEAGSRAVFGKHLSELSLAETALLTVLPNAPSLQGMASYEQADNWADTAVGALRRMEENGFINEREFVAARLEVFEKVHVSGNDADVEYMLEELDLSEVERRKVSDLARVYKSLAFEERLVTLADGSQFYQDFYEYVYREISVKSGEVFENRAEMNDLRVSYYDDLENQAIGEKWGHDPRLGDQGAGQAGGSRRGENFDLTFLDAPRATGELLSNIREEERLNLYGVSSTFQAMVRGANDAPVEYPVVGRTADDEPIVRDEDNYLWVVGGSGVERIPSRVITVDSIGAVQVQPVSYVAGIHSLPEGATISEGQLWRDVQGNYFSLSEEGVGEYVGREFPRANGEVVIVDIPWYEGVASSLEEPEAQLVEVGLRMSKQVAVTESGEDVSNKIASIDGNLITVGEENHGAVVENMYLSAGEMLARTFSDSGYQVNMIEIQRTEPGTEAVRTLIDQNLEMGMPVGVWLGSAAGSEVLSLDTGMGEIRDLEIANDNLALVVDKFSHAGEEYFVVGRLAGEQMQYSAVTEEELLGQAAPVMGSRYKVMVFNEEAPEIVVNNLYNLVEGSSQLELGLVAGENLSELEYLTTLNPQMQEWVIERGAEWVRQSGATEYTGMAMDGDGNVIFSVGLDENGQVRPGNPAAMEAYEPGSVFKLVTVAWALHNGFGLNQTIAAGHRYTYPAGTEVDNWSLDENGEVEFYAPRNVTLADLLKYSNNPASVRLVYEWAYEAGIDADSLMRFATDVLGFGEAQGIPGMPNRGGTIPITGDYGLASLGAIGQHDVRVSVLEMLRFAGALANDGVIMEPNMARGEDAVIAGQMPLSPEQLAEIHEGMLSVTSEPGGTAFHVFEKVEGYKVYGKTGTAETVGVSQAWFVGSAVHEETGEKISFAFFFRNGGEGSGVAAPAVKEMLDEYFSNLEAHRTITEPPVILSPVGEEVAEVEDEMELEAEVVEVKDEEVGMDIEPSTELFGEWGGNVEGIVRAPESFMDLVDRAVGEVVEFRDGGAWQGYRPDDNITAGNRIFDWLEAELAGKDNVRVMRQSISPDLIPFKAARGATTENEIFNVLVRMGDPEAERKVVITAHYDTTPDLTRLGDAEGVTGIGASDNGWTVAMNMELAKQLADMELPEGVEVIIALTTAEEIWYDGMDKDKRVAGANQLVNQLVVTEGVNPDNIVAINTDGLVNLQSLGGGVRLFQPDPDAQDSNDRNTARLFALYLNEVGIPVIDSAAVDREGRWGDQLAFHARNIWETIRVMAEGEADEKSERDLLPATISTETKERTGALMWVLWRVITDKRLFDRGEEITNN